MHATKNRAVVRIPALKKFSRKVKSLHIKRLETKKLGRSQEKLPIPAMEGVESGWGIECRKVPNTEFLVSNYQLSSSSSF